MGFPEDRAREALEHFEGDVESAIENLSGEMGSFSDGKKRLFLNISHQISNYFLLLFRR